MVLVISQLGITVFGVVAFLFVTRDSRRDQVIGVACGLISNPFWWAMVITTQQWIAVPVHIAYTYAWYAKAYRLWKTRD